MGKPKAGDELDDEPEASSAPPPAVAEPPAEEPDDDALDFSLKKKKKKKPKNVEEEEEGADEKPTKPAVQEPVDDDDTDFTKKKKKPKKPKETSEEAEPAAPAEDDDGDLDFSTKKKKKKKKKEEEEAEEEAEEQPEPAETGMPQDDDDDDDDDDGDDGEEGEDGFVSIPADREYKYEELLDRMYALLIANNPELAGARKRFLIKPPQVVREGSKRVVLINFGEICKTLNRSTDHVYSFMLAEMGTTGSIDASSRMVIKGRFQPKQIEQIIRRYVGEYVSCSSCKSPNTALQKQNRLYFMQCSNCGARRSVAPIKTGFVAISRAARKKNRQ